MRAIVRSGQNVDFSGFSHFSEQNHRIITNLIICSGKFSPRLRGAIWRRNEAGWVEGIIISISSLTVPKVDNDGEKFYYFQRRAAANVTE